MFEVFTKRYLLSCLEIESSASLFHIYINAPASYIASCAGEYQNTFDSKFVNPMALNYLYWIKVHCIRKWNKKLN